ncbi:hypothetical protein KM043_007838 [Ampulex compressa]|nr:hypothetical protein KM043_007838 [Ampulex compressa]
MLRWMMKDEPALSVQPPRGDRAGAPTAARKPAEQPAPDIRVRPPKGARHKVARLLPMYRHREQLASSIPESAPTSDRSVHPVQPRYPAIRCTAVEMLGDAALADFLEGSSGRSSALRGPEKPSEGGT